MRMPRLPTARPLALRFPWNEGYFLDSSFFRSPRVSGVHPPAAPGRWSTGLATPLPVLSLFGESQSDLSCSQGILCAFALLSDPGRISAPSLLWRFDSAPAVRTTKAPALIIISRLYHTAFAPLHTLRAAIADDYAMFDSGWWLAFAGWGLFSPLDPCIVFPSLVFFPFTSSSSHSGFS